MKKQTATFMVLIVLILTIVFLNDKKPIHGNYQEEKNSTDKKSDLETLKAELEVLKAILHLNKSNISHLSVFSPPVGTVMAYAGEWPPFKDNSRTEKYSAEEMWEKGWVLCAGQKFDKERYKELFRVLGKDQVPDYKKKFIRGSENNSNVGTPIGKDQIDEFNITGGNHNHDLPLVTGGIARLGGEEKPVPAETAYSIQAGPNDWKDNSGGKLGVWHIAVTNLPHHNSGHHAHDLGGTTVGTPGHTHTIPAKPTIPSSIRAHYIIKVKSKIE